MKITRVSVYQADLPYVGGQYIRGPGRVIETADTTVVVIETDAGITGCGECCPIGGNYLAAYPEGVRAAAPRLAKALIGADPRELGVVERVMDETIKGHPYAKSPFDAACWDILGKSVSLPVYMLLGGKLTDGGPMYRVVPQKPPDAAVAELIEHRNTGYRQFQIKVGADPEEDIERVRATAAALLPGERAIVDANTGWRVDEAVRVVRALADCDVYIEQPCLTYDECLQVRSRTDLPMKLDECVTGMHVAEKIVADRSAEVVCLKISNIGGLSRTRRVRDFLVDHGLAVVCEDTWGGEICTATLAHLAASTPPELLFNTTDLHNYNTVSTGYPAPVSRGGKLYVSDAPGLGVEPAFDVLSDPVAVIS